MSDRVFRDPFHFMAFGAGTGLSPRAPGTAGTVLGVLLFLPLRELGWWICGAVIVVAAVGGTWVCERVAAELDLKDPGGIVLDEIVGVWIALFLLPPDWYWLLAGFVLFRVLDIAKPWPVSWFDRELTGGLGIMADDLVAGILTCLALHGVAAGLGAW